MTTTIDPKIIMLYKPNRSSVPQLEWKEDAVMNFTLMLDGYNREEFEIGMLFL